MISTHSEHILFGLTDLVKSGKLDPEDIRVFSFSLDQESEIPTTTVQDIPFTENGDLADMPGFFETARKESKISLKQRESANYSNQ